MRTARLLLAATAASLLTGGLLAANGLGAAEPEDLSVKMVGGVVQITDANTDSGYVAVLADGKLIFDSDHGTYDVGPGCVRGQGEVEHPGYDHTDTYVECPGWNRQLIRGDMGEGYDYAELTLAPATMRAEFDLGDDGDYYFGGPGVDVVHGGAEWDELDGGAGNDELYGEADGDMLYGSAGSDLLDGGDDEDYLDYSKYRGPIVADITNGNGTVKKGNATDQVRSVEGLTDSPQNDKLTVQGRAGALFTVIANEGRDDIRSKGFASITTDNAGRDQVRAHQGVGTRGARAGQDEIACVNGRPARLEVDKGVDTLDGCARGQKAAKRAAQAPRPALSRSSGH